MKPGGNDPPSKERYGVNVPRGLVTESSDQRFPVHPFTLRFRDPEIEREYQHAAADTRFRAFRRILAIASLVAFVLWLGVETTPGIERQTVEVMRPGIALVGLVAAVAFALSYLSREYRFLDGLIVTVATCLGFVFIQGTLNVPEDQAISYGYAFIVLYVFSILTAFRLPLLTACGSAWFMSAAYLGALIFYEKVSGIVIYRHTGWLFGALILGMIACYHLEQYAREAFRKTLLLRAANEKNEDLLRNILPPVIADRLKADERSIAEGFAEVTVLFADIAGFTALSQTMSPAEVVEMLNRIFTDFDRIADRHGLEKIKTIGDAYMVAGGLPERRHDHAAAMANMALDMIETLEHYNEETEATIQMRIGINTGPVVAGVIGERKFIYDLWGDTVNIASRMESQGVTGRIQITEMTRVCLGAEFSVEPRGKIDVVGKGPMPTYFLNSRNG